jgi:hypothetical protein
VLSSLPLVLLIDRDLKTVERLVKLPQLYTCIYAAA